MTVDLNVSEFAYEGEPYTPDYDSRWDEGEAYDSTPFSTQYPPELYTYGYRPEQGLERVIHGLIYEVAILPLVWRRTVRLVKQCERLHARYTNEGIEWERCVAVPEYRVGHHEYPGEDMWVCRPCVVDPDAHNYLGGSTVCVRLNDGLDKFPTS